MSEKCIPVMGYVICNSYSPFLSSLTTHEMVSVRVPNPCVVNVVASDGKRIGFIFPPYRVHQLGTIDTPVTPPVQETVLDPFTRTGNPFDNAINEFALDPFDSAVWRSESSSISSVIPVIVTVVFPTGTVPFPDPEIVITGRAS